ncbi:MAG: hypothetical protein ACE10K_06315, partial [Rhodothermales bacterium]
GVGLAGSFYLAVAFYLVVMGASGVMRPVRQAYLHQVIPSEQRATVISFDSLVSSATSMGGQAGLGYFSQVRSIAQGYIVGGAATVLVLPVLVALRRLGGRADVIRGRAANQGVCAAEGLPDVAYLDTTRRQPAQAET